MNTRPVIILAIVVALIVGAAIWFVQNPQGGAPVASETPAPAAPAKAGPTPGVAKLTQPPRTTTGPAQTKPVVAAQPPAAPQPQPEWEARIDNVLAMNASETQVAQNLINMLPSLPPDGQEQAAQHISNLILDADYSRVLPLVKNPALPEQVHDVFFTDLMNREDTVKLPTLLEVAKIPNHPYHDEALTDLQIFLDVDNEQNWGKWDAAVKAYLKKQAADEAPAPGAAPAQ